MDTIPPSLAPWLLAVAAALLGALWVVRVFGATINEEMFVQVVKKLIAANNASRAVKLTKSAPNSPLAAATRAGILASAAPDEEAIAKAGYRGSRDPKPEALLEKIRAPFNEAFDQTAAPLRNAFWLALPSPFLLVAAIAWSASLVEVDWIAAAASGCLLLLFAYTARSYAGLLRAKKTAFGALSPSFMAIAENPRALQDEPSPRPFAVELEVREPGMEPRILRPEKSILKIGSLDKAEVKLSADGVSRVHAVMEVEETGEVSVIDLGSDNGTHVNGVRVLKQKLSDGDVLGVGQAEIVVRMAGGQSP